MWLKKNYCLTGVWPAHVEISPPKKFFLTATWTLPFYLTHPPLSTWTLPNTHFVCLWLGFSLFSASPSSPAERTLSHSTITALPNTHTHTLSSCSNAKSVCAFVLSSPSVREYTKKYYVHLSVKTDSLLLRRKTITNSQTVRAISRPHRFAAQKFIRLNYQQRLSARLFVGDPVTKAARFSNRPACCCTEKTRAFGDCQSSLSLELDCLVVAPPPHTLKQNRLRKNNIFAREAKLCSLNN